MRQHLQHGAARMRPVIMDPAGGDGAHLQRRNQGIAPELRRAAESVWEEGDNLSRFVEQSLPVNIERRKMQWNFIARGFAARDEARRSDEYFLTDEVLLELDEMLTQAETKAGT